MLQVRVMFKVPVLAVDRFVAPVALPCRARIVRKVFPARLSKKPMTVELFGLKASTITKPRFSLPAKV